MNLALTRSLHHALYLYQLIQFCFHYFYTVPYLFCLFCLCDHVDDVPFEGEQEQAYEEENQQLNEEGKWIFPLYMFHFDPNNSMMIHFIVICMKMMGILLRTLHSLFT